jgi:hypothetical protein
MLEQIRKTHRLDTSVLQGNTCGSMCVFIYLQGETRYGALSSTWLFHEVSHRDPVTKKVARLDRHAWELLVDKYFRRAGVSEPWIADMKPRTVGANYWQTGADLVRTRSGIIHKPLGNQVARIVAQPGATNAAAPAD